VARLALQAGDDMLGDAFRSRLRVTIRGAVQGVGFRPFVYRLATTLGLVGWVHNSSQGLCLEVEGSRQQLEQFLRCLNQDKPPRSFIQSLESVWLDPVGYTSFEIRHSHAVGDKTALVLPDMATCPDCVHDIFDLANRRYRYPFTNCTNCGPRFSLIEALPYDRANTSMRDFVMCAACQREYENPLDRRFHAQPNACPTCGPHLALWDTSGTVLATHHKALLLAAEGIRQGQIVAVKGLGGFHLVVDAGNDRAVTCLRQRKHREAKPLALMFPSVSSVKAVCRVSAIEEHLLLSPAAPIVLLQRRHTAEPKEAPRCRGAAVSTPLAPSVAPGNPSLGVMLPYTPLHHLLLRELGFAVVATSGNLSDEPMCTDEYEALQRLHTIADMLLVHNRPIVRHVDDSVVRLLLGQGVVLRRARGYAPLPVRLKAPTRPVIAVGAHLKNAVAFTAGNNVFLSQHIGDLETPEAFGAFQKVLSDCQRLYNVRPEHIACDRHPDYLSTRYAKASQAPTTMVQHHYAHVLSCMAEHELAGQVLGVAWDGGGYGLDSTIWGGEFLLATEAAFQRAGCLRTFRLPGGERAIKEPRRTAIGVLYEILGEAVFDTPDLPPLQTFSSAELRLLHQMLAQQVNAPLTSSAGRLFDAIAALVGLQQRVSFEGQAAMALEFALQEARTEETYAFGFGQTAQVPVIVDWEPVLRAVIDDVRHGVPTKSIAAKFHNTLADIIVAMAQRCGQERVILSGGCFQNKYLTERAVWRLAAAGFRPYWHRRVPPNDGGIALGQAVAASARYDGRLPHRQGMCGAQHQESCRCV
jgi:hydrogenase maturation protein HypF